MGHAAQRHELRARAHPRALRRAARSHAGARRPRHERRARRPRRRPPEGPRRRADRAAAPARRLLRGPGLLQRAERLGRGALHRSGHRRSPAGPDAPALAGARRARPRLEQPPPHLLPRGRRSRAARLRSFSVYERVFAGAGLDRAALERQRRERASVLDLVQGDLADLEGRLGAEHRPRLEAHLESIRELERQLDAALAAGACTAPEIGERFDPSANGSYPLVSRLQLDLCAAAFACDATRVATVLYSGGNSYQTFPWIGVPEQHHALSHEGDGNRDAQRKLTARRRVVRGGDRALRRAPRRHARRRRLAARLHHRLLGQRDLRRATRTRSTT
ncbi:MAG: DUF1552 domain-containing protein [Sandaracinaceae bacterium]|nr:DUF1552 domain-containing protein [Sandaracinaceae bacterium]